MPAAAGGLPTAADGRSVPYFSIFYSNRTGLRPNNREVPRKSKLWALPLLSMFQSYFQWKNIINPSSTLHIRCLFWWKKEIYIFFPKWPKEVAGGPFTEETKTSPTAGSPRGRTERRLVKLPATRTTNLRSAALPQKRCLAGNRRLVEHGDNNYSLELLFSLWETNLSYRNRALNKQLCWRLPQV